MVETDWSNWTEKLVNQFFPEYEAEELAKSRVYKEPDKSELIEFNGHQVPEYILERLKYYHDRKKQKIEGGERRYTMTHLSFEELLEKTGVSSQMLRSLANSGVIESNSDGTFDYEKWKDVIAEWSALTIPQRAARRKKQQQAQSVQEDEAVPSIASLRRAQPQRNIESDTETPVKRKRGRHKAVTKAAPAVHREPTIAPAVDEPVSEVPKTDAAKLADLLQLVKEGGAVLTSYRHTVTVTIEINS